MSTNTVVLDRVWLRSVNQPPSSLPQLLASLFPPPKRSLKPVPKQRTMELIQVKSCDLLVQIVGAKHIPLRTISDVGLAF